MKKQSKFRQIALSLAVSTALVAPSVWSLGLGEIDSNTKLNQPLKAKIKLLSSKEFDANELSAKIASYEAYTKFGVERETVHGQLKFVVETAADGSKYLNVTSNQGIKEPFLNFLVELNWPQGRLLREYTLLLDPPSLGQANTQVVTVAKPAQTKPAVTQSKPRQSNRQQAGKPRQNTRPRSQVAFTGDSWRVGRGQTLWSIASQLRPEGATVNQTLAALYRNNPNAFINNDIDRLKAGAVLKVPATAKVKAVASNVNYLNLRKNNLAQEAPLDVRKIVDEKASVDNKPAEGRLTISSVTESESTNSSGALTEEGATGNPAQGNSTELLETVESLRIENEQLKKELEAVKSQSDTGLTVEDETLSVLAGSAQAKDDTDEALQNLLLETEAANKATQALDSSNAVANVEQKPNEPVSSSTEKSFWQKEGFWKWPLIILAALLGLLGLGYFLKRRQAELDTNLVADGLNYQSNSDAKKQPSFASQPLQAPDVETDPIEESDILIARGQLDKAEELLAETLVTTPDNHSVRVKLMEVYGSNNKVDKIQELYRTFPEGFDHDSKLGLKVASLMQLYANKTQSQTIDSQVDDALMIKESDVFGDNNDAGRTGVDETDDGNNELDLSDDLEDALDSAMQTSNDSEDNNQPNVVEFDSGDEAVEGDNASEDAEQLSDDEVTTKLELAKAYIAMGDDESAKEILQEVEREGNPEQQRIAAEMLADI